MKKLNRLSILVLLILFLTSCANELDNTFKVNELSSWCILGFDSLDRTPKERIAMLNELGLTKYGFNKGKGDLSTMKEEFNLAKENNIEITSVFFMVKFQKR